MSYEIKKNIPVPTKQRGGKVISTLESMEVGDCVEGVKSPGSWVAAAKRLGMKVTVRDNGNGFTVWRAQ